VTLPDTLERIGVVVGSVLLLALPTSALSSMLYGVGDAPAVIPYLWLLPGLVVGLLVATDRLAITYHQLWKFSLASYFAASLGPVVLSLDPPGEHRVLAVGWWLIAVAVGLVVARTRVRESLASAIR